jgi:hypothetical protein
VVRPPAGLRNPSAPPVVTPRLTMVAQPVPYEVEKVTVPRRGIFAFLLGLFRRDRVQLSAVGCVGSVQRELKPRPLSEVRYTAKRKEAALKHGKPFKCQTVMTIGSKRHGIS